MKPIRVAHVITRLCRGGAQENTFHTVRVMRSLNTPDGSPFEVDLISGPTSGPEGSLEDRVTDAGIAILRAPHLIRPAHPWHDLAALRHLTRLLRAERYDIVHTHTSKAGFLGRWAAQRADVPVVVHTPHGHVFDGYFASPVTRMYIRLERRAARWTDRIIALTEDEIETYLQHGIGHRSQYVVIPSGVDLAPVELASSRRDATRAALGVPSHAFVIGAVGRLEPIKGFDRLIRAVPRVLQHVPDAVVLIVGEGSLEADLRQQAQPAGERIRFLGYREDVPALMAAFDLLAVPSRNEGMGRVVVEAGAAELPVVAAAVGGLPHVVDHGTTGLLVPPDDIDMFASALTALAQDPPRRRAMGRAARRKFDPAYRLETMVASIANVYHELMQRAAPPGIRQTLDRGRT